MAGGDAFPAVLGDAALDADGGSHRGETVFAGDLGGLAGGHGAVKVFELGAKWFLLDAHEILVLDELGVVELGELGEFALGDLLADVGELGGVGGAGDDGAGLLGVVDAHVGVGGEEPHLALGLEGQPRGGEIGHRAVGVLDAGVGDVFKITHDSDAHGAHFLDRGADEALHDVDVVDHHVEHHAHVDGAKRHGADAVDFNELGGQGEFLERDERRVETLGVADLHDAALAGGKFDDGPAVLDVGGQGLFNQQIDTFAQKQLGDGAVMHRGRGDGGGANMEARGQKLGDRGKGPAVVLRGDPLGGGAVGVDHRGELKARHAGVIAGVMLAHAANADNCCLDGFGHESSLVLFAGDGVGVTFVLFGPLGFAADALAIAAVLAAVDAF